jgi:hypothetical protein
VTVATPCTFSDRIHIRRSGAPVDLGIIGQAAGLFAVTNIDDI